MYEKAKKLCPFKWMVNDEEIFIYCCFSKKKFTEDVSSSNNKIALEMVQEKKNKKTEKANKIRSS